MADAKTSCVKVSDSLEAQGLIERVHGLTDLELAMLLCLAANEHCIIEHDQPRDVLLEQELQLIASHVLGLCCSKIHCTEKTTLEDIPDGLLIDDTENDTAEENARPFHDSDQDKASRTKDSQGRLKHPVPKLVTSPRNERQDQCMANVVIVTGLVTADEQIQIQILELLRTRRMSIRTEVHTAPKHFLVVILQSNEEGPLLHHLNDNIFISHYHDPEDGYSNIEEIGNVEDDDAKSMSSVIHYFGASQIMDECSPGLVPSQDISMVAKLSQVVTITAEVKAYLHNLIVFLRLNRAVANGVSPIATKHLDRLSRILTAIHGQSFITPAIIGLAFSKVYRHRVQIASVDLERSMQYGSHPRIIKSILDELTVDTILENVLQEVEVPV